MVLKALSLGHVYACIDEFGHLPSLFFFLVSFGSAGLAALEELCSVMVLSDVSLACSGLFIACDAGSLHLPFLFSFYLVLMSSSFDGCLAVEEHLLGVMRLDQWRSGFLVICLAGFSRWLLNRRPLLAVVLPVSAMISWLWSSPFSKGLLFGLVALEHLQQECQIFLSNLNLTCEVEFDN